MSKYPDLRARFESFVEKSSDLDGCWVWTGNVDAEGYGQLVVMDPTRESGRRTLKAHRLAFEFEHGREAEHHVCHKCDTPGCVRPSHLFEGDDQANNRDMTLKGRNIFQRKNPSRKLSVADVFAIKIARWLDEPLKTIAARHGVRESTISRIANGVRRRGHTWL